MNRRSFFGFACGGVVAGPAALVGQGSTVHSPSRVEIRQLTVKVDVASDGKFQAYVDRSISESIAAARGPHDSRRG